MHIDLQHVLLLVALLCFVVSACGISTWTGDKGNLTAAGLAFLALAMLLGPA